MFNEKCRIIEGVEVFGANGQLIKKVGLNDRPDTGSVFVEGTSLIISPFGAAGFDGIGVQGNVLRSTYNKNHLTRPVTNWGFNHGANLDNNSEMWVYDVRRKEILHLKGFREQLPKR